MVAAVFLQAQTAPTLPWWVLYVAIVALAWGTWRLAKSRWWAGCLGAAVGWFVLVAIAALTIPADGWGLIVVLPFIPPLVCAWTLLGRRAASRAAGVGPRFPGPAFRQLPPGVMEGQPSARAVQRSKVMVARYQAGMPRNAAFIARLRYVSGLGDLSPRPVDLFVGGGRVWVAPLTAEPPPPVPLPVRDVLRVDVWPEIEGPPTLRVNWSPPGAEGTRDLVLATLPAVPANLVTPQLEAIAAVLTGLIRAETQAIELADDAPEPPPAPAELSACPRCGETLPPGATACPRCALPV